MNKKYNKTPYFEYHKEAVESVIQEFKKVQAEGIEVFYAVKANHYEKLIRQIVKAGFGFDVASINEILHVMKFGADPSKLVYAAPAKRLADIKRAKNLGIKVFMADTIFGVENISQVFHNEKHAIVLRMQGHGSHAIFDLSDKFGLNQAEAERILREGKLHNYQIRGLTFHVGSQNLDIDAWHNAFTRIVALGEQFKQYGHSLEIIDLGGGVPASYDDSVLKRRLYLKALIHLSKRIKQKFPGVKVAIEPGRAIAAEAFSLFTSIVDIKDYKETPVIIVDTSVFAGLVEAIYDLNYPIHLVRRSRARVSKYIIGGITCDGCDIIYKSAMLPSDVRIGDLLEITHAGSYTSSWEQVHLLSWPKIVTLKGD